MPQERSAKQRIVTKKESLRFGVCNLEGVAKLSDKAKTKLLRQVFRIAGLNAQCTFIKGLEVVLGSELAQRWRAQHSFQRGDEPVH